MRSDPSSRIERLSGGRIEGTFPERERADDEIEKNWQKEDDTDPKMRTKMERPDPDGRFRHLRAGKMEVVGTQCHAGEGPRAMMREFENLRLF